MHAGIFSFTEVSADALLDTILPICPNLELDEMLGSTLKYTQVHSVHFVHLHSHSEDESARNNQYHVSQKHETINKQNTIIMCTM